MGRFRHIMQSLAYVILHLGWVQRSAQLLRFTVLSSQFLVGFSEFCGCSNLLLLFQALSECSLSLELLQLLQVLQLLLLLLEEDVLALIQVCSVLPLVLLLSLGDDLLNLQVHLLECWGWAFFVEALVNVIFETALARLVHSCGGYAAIVEADLSFCFCFGAQTLSWALV